MAKDPAFLFYSSDFLTGTMMMTDEEVGQYIRLLCYQHQRGHINAVAMQRLCGGIASASVKEKFKVDSDGLFFNQRLEDEMLKRKIHSEKQSNNARMRWHKSGIAVAMPLENENRNENENIVENENKEKEGTGGKTKIPHLFRESDIFDKAVFTLKLEQDERYASAHMDYYHEVILNWSDEGNRKKNWLSLVKRWMLRDLKEGQFVDKNFNPNKFKNGSKNQQAEQHGLDQLERIRTGKL